MALKSSHSDDCAFNIYLLVNNVIKFCVIVLILLNCCFYGVTYGLKNNTTIVTRESRKLFGGYRITPRFCQPTRTIPGVKGGPSICMFNHECAQRNGHVVGACMDGFLFGACCQLPATENTDLSPQQIPDTDVVIAQDNTIIEDTKHSTIKPINSDLKLTPPQQTPVLEITPDNAIVQIHKDENVTFQPMVTNSYPNSAETVLIHTNGTKVNNHISSEDFSTVKLNDKTSTSRVESSTKPFYYHSSINYLTATRRPSDTDKYVLVPTITKPTALQATSNTENLPEIESIANIIQMLDDTAPNRLITTDKSETKSPTSSTLPNYSTPLVYSNIPTFSSSTQKPPSTSYVYSTTISPRPGYTKNPALSTSYTYSSTGFTVTPKTTTKSKPTTSYLFSPTKRPLTTITTTTNTKKGTSKKPTKTTTPYYTTPVAHYSTNLGHSPSPSPPPTVIVLGPFSETSSSSTVPSQMQYNQMSVVSSSTPRPKPVSQVTINNMIQSSNTLHIGGRPGSTTATSERPGAAPTVLITPKPSSASTSSYWATTQQRPYQPTTIIVKKPDEDGVQYLTTSGIMMGSSSTSDDLINFPPVRNPNLNMSASPTEEYETGGGNFEITTPTFLEDDELNDKVETFVNKIIQSLQGPFDDLRTVVYSNKTTAQTTKKPTKKPVTTTPKKPIKIETTTRKPVTTTKKAPVKKPTTKKPTTQKLTTRRPTTSSSAVTTKRTKPSRKTTTSTTSTTRTPPVSSSSEETYEESDEYYEDNNQSSSPQTPDYKRLCGVRPLMRSGRIVGGKGATFGEWPWQVLVKESTWLGLFTKNKCGGVLISSKYVITAAHCQPGFLASLVAVFGEFDISGELESKRSLNRPVKRVIVHRQYNAATFENDLALLELDTPVQFDTHIVPICLPGDDEDFTGRMATVTGWGRLKYGGGVPSVLQEVQVPIMENSVCQEMFRTAGHSKIIIESFLCAGYANGQKDSCEGDSGGPLTLQRGDGRWELAGTVSHGIKCAAPYLPGVYMRTTYFKPWLSSITGLH